MQTARSLGERVSAFALISEIHMPINAPHLLLCLLRLDQTIGEEVVCFLGDPGRTVGLAML